jgi:hypothetical protein
VARERPRSPWALAAPVAGLAAAVLLHAGWNLAASIDDAFAPTYVVIMVPVFVGTLWLVRRSLDAEARVIRRHLAPLVASGVLTDAELACLCTLRGRAAATVRAARHGGVAGWRRRVALHREVAELAFTRWRAERDGATIIAVEEARLVRLRALCVPPDGAPVPADPARAPVSPTRGT